MSHHWTTVLLNWLSEIRQVELPIVCQQHESVSFKEPTGPFQRSQQVFFPMNKRKLCPARFCNEEVP